VSVPAMTRRDLHISDRTKYMSHRHGFSQPGERYNEDR
jgi:hypothetical protein